jgi:hypothetical protein
MIREVVRGAEDGQSESDAPRRDRRPPRVPAPVREERRQTILSLRSTGFTIHAIACDDGDVVP